MKQKVVFIASLSHSGSTLINLLLGAHPQLVGLGEVDTVLQMNAARLESEKVMRCSCGERVRDCVFWAPVIAALLAEPKANLVERYSILFDCFQQQYGRDVHLVDSSKYLGQLRTVSYLPQVDLKVVHLIKDVRGFAVSQRDATDPEMKYRHLPVLAGSVNLSRWVYLHSIKTSTYLFWKWYLRNQAVRRMVGARALKNIQIGYDELAQYPEAILKKLYGFLELPVPNELSVVPERTNSHAFMGNPMLGDPQKMGGVRYDDRWKTRRDWKLAAHLFPFILNFNQKAVYSNSLLAGNELTGQSVY